MADTETFSLDWLKQQLRQLRSWRLAVSETGEPDTLLAERIARHEAWLEARLEHLGARAA